MRAWLWRMNIETDAMTTTKRTGGTARGSVNAALWLQLKAVENGHSRIATTMHTMVRVVMVSCTKRSSSLWMAPSEGEEDEDVVIEGEDSDGVPAAGVKEEAKEEVACGAIVAEGGGRRK